MIFVTISERVLLVLQVADNLAQAEHAHCHHDETDAVGQFGNIERESLHARS